MSNLWRNAINGMKFEVGNLRSTFLFIFQDLFVLTIIVTMPRKTNNRFSEFNFTLVKRNNKYAHCDYCNHELSNTSFCRLKAHR